MYVRVEREVCDPLINRLIDLILRVVGVLFDWVVGTWKVGA
jgi:hypothetical protein